MPDVDGGDTGGNNDNDVLNDENDHDDDMPDLEGDDEPEGEGDEKLRANPRMKEMTVPSSHNFETQPCSAPNVSTWNPPAEPDGGISYLKEVDSLLSLPSVGLALRRKRVKPKKLRQEGMSDNWGPGGEEAPPEIKRKATSSSTETIYGDHEIESFDRSGPTTARPSSRSRSRTRSPASYVGLMMMEPSSHNAGTTFESNENLSPWDTPESNLNAEIQYSKEIDDLPSLNEPRRDEKSGTQSPGSDDEYSQDSPSNFKVPKDHASAKQNASTLSEPLSAELPPESWDGDLEERRREAESPKLGGSIMSMGDGGSEVNRLIMEWTTLTLWAN